MKKNLKQRHEQAPKELFGSENVMKAIRITNPLIALKEDLSQEWEQINGRLHVQWVKPGKESKNIAAYTYSEKEAMLVVKFHNDTVYSYKQVSSELFRELVLVDDSGESLGSWIIKTIIQKKHNFPYTREN